MTMKDGSFKSSLFICFFPFRTPNVSKEIAGLKSPRSAERIQSVSSSSSLGSLLRCHPLVAILVASIKRRASFSPSLVCSSRGSVRGWTLRTLNPFRSSLYNLHSSSRCLGVSFLKHLHKSLSVCPILFKYPLRYPCPNLSWKKALLT